MFYLHITVCTPEST